MQVRAISKYIRISPRKTRLVVDVIRGRSANESLEILEAMDKRAAKITQKVLHSAVANARQKEIDIDKLWVKEVKVDGGPLYKRYMPRAMGRATMIKRPTSHINIVLTDEVKGYKPVSSEEAEKQAEDKKGKQRLLSKIRRPKKKTTPQKSLHKQKTKKK